MVNGCGCCYGFFQCYIQQSRSWGVHVARLDVDEKYRVTIDQAKKVAEGKMEKGFDEMHDDVIDYNDGGVERAWTLLNESELRGLCTKTYMSAPGNKQKRT